MNKYVLLVILCMPFVIFGLLKAVMVYRTKGSSRASFLLRIFFWIIIAAGLIFAKPIYDFLTNHGLTDSSPLSIPDVVLTAGVILVLSLSIRLYAKFDHLEKRVSDLQEKLSIITSTKE